MQRQAAAVPPASVDCRGFALRCVLVGGLCAALSFAAGCSPGVRWQLGTYAEVQADARAEGKLLFVYFRNWYLVESTRFEEDVLKDPEVRAALAPFVSVPLEYSIARDQELAERWGIYRVPAFAIVDPDERVLATGAGEITKDELLAALAQAQQQAEPPPQPSPQP